MAARLHHPDPAHLVVRVGPMRRRHLRTVMRIDQAVYPRPWTRGIFMAELSHVPSRRQYLVARVEGEVVGYGGLMFSGEDAHVTTLAVATEWQRRTIATRLLLALNREAIQRGATALTLEVRKSNDAAQALYRRFGLAPAGMRRNYYAAEREDALVMWAHDIHEPEHRARLARIEGDLPGVTLLDPALTVVPDERGRDRS